MITVVAFVTVARARCTAHSRIRAVCGRSTIDRAVLFLTVRKVLREFAQSAYGFVEVCVASASATLVAHAITRTVQ